MSRSSHDNSYSRRKSLFALTALRSHSRSPSHASDTGLAKSVLRKTRHARTSSTLVIDSNDDSNVLLKDHGLSDPPSPLPESPQRYPRRPSVVTVGSEKRPPSSALESLNSTSRASSEDLSGDVFAEPLSATPSTTPSLGYEGIADGTSPARNVLLHGEVQTSAGMFRKKKEYLVLTETFIIRYKSQTKAAETFTSIPHPGGRSPTVRHQSAQSVGSFSDLQTVSDSSGDKDGRVPLRQIVAVYKLDDGKPYFALEFSHLDEESGQASSMTLQFGNREERDMWLRLVRRTANEVRQRERTYITPFNLGNAARIVERDNDYDPANCAIFKVAQRQSTPRLTVRSSSDDLVKVATTVCFVAIGLHKIHLIQLVKGTARTNNHSLTTSHSQAPCAILTLSSIRVSAVDDTFELSFRQPMQKSKTLYLASLASHDIAARLHYCESFLRPECGHRLIRLSAPKELEESLLPPAQASVEEHNCLDRTLIAYCVAYGVNPTNVRYTINYEGEDAPRFELLPPFDPRRPYSPLELLAIMRALRYNESFGSISFAGISLDSLNGLHDHYGREMVCTRTKRGTPIRLSPEELGRSCLLVQEVRGLAATSKKLRRMDFSGCIAAKQMIPDPTDEEPQRTRDIGCGIVEALFPLCKHQTTNVDWICLNGIELSDTDLDYLVGAAVDKSCHFRAIELNRCGLSDRSMGLILDALRAQENTLESLQIAGNTARLNPATFDSQLGFFGFIRKLNLSYVSRTSGTESLLQPETLLIWRLQELRLSGLALNAATVDSVATYLAHPQSQSLHELYIDNSYLSGNDIATLLHSLSWDQSRLRNMHLDISQNHIGKGLEEIAEAISTSMTPSHLSMRAIEYREEAQFRKILNALAVNKSIRYLDMSQTALPGDATEETCRTLGGLLSENDTLIELNLSGEDSRLATSRFGPGINDALMGLKSNKSLEVFRIEKQKLGLQGASALADVLRENQTLLELHCDNNEIPLHGLTDLVNSLVENTTLIFLPTMNDGRAAAVRSAEATMKVMSDMETQMPTAGSSKPVFSGALAVRRGFASVRKTAQRSASSHTPSFPALSSLSRSSTSPDGQLHPSFSKSSHSSKPRYNSQSPPVAPTSTFTAQDIQTTHRLLTEQWDRQCYRLGQYLERNWCRLNSLPHTTEVEDEKFERPGSVGSIGKILEQVRYESTPRAEKAVYFEAPSTNAAQLSATSLQTMTSLDDEKHSVSFKQYILQSEPQSSIPVDSSGEDEKAGSLRHLRVDSQLDRSEEPGTPTQQAFAAG